MTEATDTLYARHLLRRVRRCNYQPTRLRPGERTAWNRHLATIRASWDARKRPVTYCLAESIRLDPWGDFLRPPGWVGPW